MESITPNQVAEVLAEQGHYDLAGELRKREGIEKVHRQRLSPMDAEEIRRQRLAAVDAGARAMEATDTTHSETSAADFVRNLPREEDYDGLAQGYERDNGVSLKERATAVELDQPELVRAIQHEKPSKQHKTDLYVCRVYRRSGGDCQIYEDVKHCWWTADSSVLVIVQYTNPDRTAWRNISWLREVIDWYTLTHQEFE